MRESDVAYEHSLPAITCEVRPQDPAQWASDACHPPAAWRSAEHRPLPEPIHPQPSSRQQETGVAGESACQIRETSPFSKRRRGYGWISCFFKALRRRFTRSHSASNSHIHPQPHPCFRKLPETPRCRLHPPATPVMSETEQGLRTGVWQDADCMARRIALPQIGRGTFGGSRVHRRRSLVPLRHATPLPSWPRHGQQQMTQSGSQ